MRSYADTLNPSGAKAGATTAGACLKFAAVLVACCVIAGAVFAGIRFIKDDPDDIAPSARSETGAVRRDWQPARAPVDPTSDDPDDPVVVPVDPRTGELLANDTVSENATVVAPLPPAFTQLRTVPIVDQDAMDFRYADMLGDTFFFFEAQHSGNISDIDGGNRIGWRAEQLLDDGQDVGVDLTGGVYEAGNRLKITLPTAYYVSHLAWMCHYYHAAYKKVMYDGKDLLHWCKREVRWSTDWLLKTHLYKGKERPAKWSEGDSLVVMVGKVPDDWNCYERAELIPTGIPAQDCEMNTRATLLANSTHHASDVALYASSAFAATAAFLQSDDPEYAVECMRAAYAMYNYGTVHNRTAGSWSEQVKRTYGTTHSGQYMLWASAMIAWAHRCTDTKLPLCSERKARGWLSVAEQHWEYEVEGIPERHATHMISNWATPDYDSALLLTATTGNLTSPYAKHVRDYIQEYAKMNGQVTATPKGLVRHKDEEWSPLRLAYQSAHTALHYSSFPGADSDTVRTAQCFARAQMGYVAGDNPNHMSYVAGFGAKWPQQVHHRDASCTLQEAVEGDCISKDNSFKMFYEKRPNPITLIGAVVGGPDEKDDFKDERNLYKFTEVALDYNTGLMSALSGMLTLQPSFWSAECTTVVPKFKYGPYPAKGTKATSSAYQRGEDPNKGLDIDPETAKEAEVAFDPDADYSKMKVPEAPLL